MFRSGTTSLPITSPNLTFREFLSKMNKSQQIQITEQFEKMDIPLLPQKKIRTLLKPVLIMQQPLPHTQNHKPIVHLLKSWYTHVHKETLTLKLRLKDFLLKWLLH